MNARMRLDAQQEVILEVQVSEAYKQWQAHVNALWAEYYTRVERGQSIIASHAIHEQALDFINGVSTVIDKYGNFMTLDERGQLQAQIDAYLSAYDAFEPQLMIDHAESLGELYKPIVSNVETRYSNWAIQQTTQAHNDRIQSSVSNWLGNVFGNISGLVSKYIPKPITNIVSGIVGLFSQNLLPAILGSIAVLGLSIMAINTVDFTGINYPNTDQYLYVAGITPEQANNCVLGDEPNAGTPYPDLGTANGMIYLLPVFGWKKRRKRTYISFLLMMLLAFVLAGCGSNQPLPCITAGEGVSPPPPDNEYQENAINSGVFLEAGYDCEPTAVQCNCTSPANVISSGAITEDGIWISGHIPDIDEEAYPLRGDPVFSTNANEAISYVGTYECVEFSGSNGTVAMSGQDFVETSTLIDENPDGVLIENDNISNIGGQAVPTAIVDEKALTVDINITYLNNARCTPRNGGLDDCSYSDFSVGSFELIECGEGLAFKQRANGTLDFSQPLYACIVSAEGVYSDGSQAFVEAGDSGTGVYQNGQLIGIVHGPNVTDGVVANVNFDEIVFIPIVEVGS